MNSLRLSAHRSIFSQTKKQTMARKTKDLHRQQQQQEKDKEQKQNRERDDDSQSRKACEQRAKKARESSENSESKQQPSNNTPSPPLIRPTIMTYSSVDDYCSHSGEYDGVKFEIMDTVSGSISNTNNTHVITHSCSSPTSSKTKKTTTPAVKRSSNISNSFRINQNTGNLLRLTVPAGKAVRTVAGVLVACSTNIKVRKRMDLKASSVMKQLASVPTAALPMPLAVPLSLASGASSGSGGGGKEATSIWYDEITCEEYGVDVDGDEVGDGDGDGDGNSKAEGKNQGDGDSENEGKGDSKIDGDGDVAVDGSNNIDRPVNVDINKKTTAGWVLLSLLNGQIHMLHLVDDGMHGEYTIMAGQFLASIGDVINVKAKGMFATYKGNGIIFVITYGSSLSCTLEACDQDQDIDLNQDERAAASTTTSPNDSFCVDRSKLIAWTSGTVTVEAVNKKFLPVGSKSIKAPSMSMSTSSTQNDLVQLSGSGHVIIQCNTGKQLASWLYDCKAPS